MDALVHYIIQAFGPSVITQLDKVVILQYILDGVIRVQQTRTLAPSRHEASVLHRRDAAVVRFVLDVTFERLVSEPPDGVGGVPAWHRQPLIADVHSKTRHCASAGVCCTERCVSLCRSSLSAAHSGATNHTPRWRGPPRRRTPPGDHWPPGVSHTDVWTQWPRCVQVTQRQNTSKSLKNNNNNLQV